MKDKKEVTYYEFIKTICSDHNISIDKEYTLKLPADKRVMKWFTRSRAGQIRIFDGNAEHPYMVDGTRNDGVLVNGNELRIKDTKSFDLILKETGVKLQSGKCKICEGGGWYSEGTRYIYKDIYCEI